MCVLIAAIIYATGFDAVNGQFSGVQIIGRDQTQSLGEKWSQTGPTTLYGTHSHSFPNMFMMLG